MKKPLLIISILFIAFSSNAQVRQIPDVVKETFHNQYPAATDVDYDDLVVKVVIKFTLDGADMKATYNNKGAWKGTEKEIEYDEVSDDVKDGFNKSKYAGGWEETESILLYLPGGSTQYRIRVKKSDVQLKYLFFNTKGRLVRTSITI
jgi:hypothetical protein